MKKIVLLVFAFTTLNISLILLANTPASNAGEEYLAFAEQMPAPEGGLQAIYSKVEYPKTAVNAGLQGKVYVLAFINENGGVDEVKIIKGIGGGCDEAAIAAVQSTKFSPAKNKGVAVKVKYSLPITFKL